MTTKKLPKNWAISKIGTIFETATGNTPPKKDIDNYFPRQIKFIKPPELLDSEIHFSEDFLSEKGKEKARVLPKSSVLVSCIGNLGKIGFAVDEIAFNQQINAILPSRHVSPKFAFYQLLSNRFKAELEAKGSSTTVTIVNKSKFEDISFILPPFLEQKRIVEKIEKLFKQIDSSVASLQKTQEKIAHFRETILSKSFSHVGKHIILSNACDYIQRGKSPKYTNKSKLPVINQKCVRWDTLQKQYLKYIDPSQFKDWTKERFVREGDILWNSTGTGTIGRAYLLSESDVDVPMVVDSHVTILRPNKLVLFSKYAFYFIMSPIIQRQIENLQAGSTNQVELNRSRICNTEIPLPSLPEQRKIVAEIEKQFAAADKMQKAVDNALENAKKLKQAILKKAFNGELVPQDPKDQPAAALLTKIKAERAAKSKTNLKQSKRTSK